MKLKLFFNIIETLIGLTSLFSAMLSNTVTYTAPITHTPIVEAEEVIVETLEEKIYRIALSHGIATSTLYDLAFSESSLGEKRVGDQGKSCGVIHFHKDYYPEENSRCDDDEYILNRAAEMIANDEEWKFVPCNCYAFAEVMTVGRLPKMMDIVPNAVHPKVGALAILRYRNNKHIGVITKVVAEGVWIKEANFKPCSLGLRLVSFQDPHLKGYYSLDDD